MNIWQRIVRSFEAEAPLAGSTQSTAPHDPFDLDRPLFMLSPHDAFSIRQAAEGISIMGGIGSGKTSGSGETIARAMLEAGFGGTVMCAKAEECEAWVKMARQTGREEHLVILRPDQPWRFNFIDYQMQQGDGLVENVVALVSTVSDMVKGKQSQGGGDPFWDRAMQMLLRNAIELLFLARGTLTLDDLCQFVADAPRNKEEVGDSAWQEESFCATIIAEAAGQAETPQQRQGFEVASRFMLKQYVELGDRTRSSIEATFLAMADSLLHGVAWELLSTTTNLVPEVTFADGRIIILDLPIQQYHDVGRTVQGIFKYMFQRAVLQRDTNQYPRPVFLWADEAQNFVSSFDYKFQAVARSARACTVYLSQSVSNYYSVLGGGEGRDETHAFLGNLVTKVFHANSDHATNQYASDLIGQHWMTVYNFGSSQNAQQPGDNRSAGGSQSVQYKVLPAQFTTLRKGGPKNNLEVDGIVFQGGRTFHATGDTYMKAVFKQQ